MFIDSLDVCVDSFLRGDGLLDEMRDQLAALGITDADVDMQTPVEGEVFST